MVAIVDANCSTVKKILKNSSISICISVQAWEEGGEEPQYAEFLSFVGMGSSKHIAWHYQAIMCQLSLASERVSHCSSTASGGCVWELEILN